MGPLNIEQLSILFGTLASAGLKVNAPEYRFGLQDIPYLGYVITLEGIKHEPNKVQGIMDIDLPTTTTEVWSKNWYGAVL